LNNAGDRFYLYKLSTGLAKESLHFIPNIQPNNIMDQHIKEKDKTTI
jgi:hypothetical protein